MKPEWFPDWTGETCVIVAGGPSASTVDLSLARGKCRVIVINASWRLAPWADVLYACDDSFWRTYDGVPEFKGLKVTQDSLAIARFCNRSFNGEPPGTGIKQITTERRNDHLVLDRPGIVGWGGNSGFHALNLAAQFGAKRILLVGYDMRLDRGMHWFGVYPKSMNNPIERNVERWRRVVDAAAPVLRSKGISVINCSAVSKLQSYIKRDFAAAVSGDMSTPTTQPMRQVKRLIAIGLNYTSPADLSSYGDQYSYFLQQEFRKRGIEIVPVQRGPRAIEALKALRLEEFDGLIGFGIRQINKDFTRELLAPIRKRLRGAIAQIGEFPPEDSHADVTFVSKEHFRRPNHKYPPWRLIGWAADSDICRPEQEQGGPLRILFDHPDYDPKRQDFTDQFADQVKRFTRNEKLWRRAGYTGVELDYLTTPKGGAARVPFPEIAKKYNRAHLFFMTHGESVGMSVIEAGTAGCLVVTPRGFMDKVLINTVRRIETEGADVPWETVLRKIDPKASREKATLQSWSAVADKVLAGLQEFCK